ncbi:hypothetical protein FSP39_007718 [Pinctada imbricata]|uniref:Uncharacterized protein n=1 Tax=Pinctada imbricata TaxID=66713 RepID=A0AA88YMK6_PINIB|nr:hypothetical protein FSP39_007718 [Pinctada imbricata]
MDKFWKNKRKKNILVLPVGSQIPKEKLKKILKNYDVYIEEENNLTDSTTGKGDHGNDLLTSTDKGKETMKKSTTLLFIPSFRKRKKSAKYQAVPTDVHQPHTGLRDISFVCKSDIPNPAGRIPANSVRSCDSDSGRDSDSVGSGPSDNASIRSSSSSLEGLVTHQRSSSLDSGIDSLCPPTAMLPESHPVAIQRSGDISSCTKGRAPIASPEDDSLLVTIEEEDTSSSSNAVTSMTCGNSVSFGTLSDCSSSCSCDSSDSEDDSQQKYPYSSDSDSDLEGMRCHGNRKTDSVSSGSDSDSDFDQCSEFYSAAKCSTSQPLQNSSHSSIVHRQIVNSGRTLRKVFSRAKIKTNGSVKNIKKSSVHSVSKPPSSMPSVSGGHHSFPQFLLHHERTLRTGQSSDSVSGLKQSLCDKLPSTSSQTLSRTHSVADKNRKPVMSVRRSHSFHDQQRVSSTSIEVPQEPLLPSSNLSVLDSTIPDICASTNKSPTEVRKSLQKTAFWVENNAYDKKAELSPPIHTKPPVSERDLCQEIIGIYFGEDSDSSLSSSFLDSSVDHVSLTPPTEHHVSPPRTLETNLDDFTTATYVPVPYTTSKATTRKICNASVDKTTSRQSLSVNSRSSHPERTRHTDRQSVPTRSKDSKPVTFLSEHEVDTITKFHTLCNGQRIVKYLNMSESPMIHFPPPKSASRISWHQKLEDCDLDSHSPRVTPTKPKSALRQRPKDFQFPYVEDKPSPIVVTRLRRSKSLNRSRDWPW